MVTIGSRDRPKGVAQPNRGNSASARELGNLPARIRRDPGFFCSQACCLVSPKLGLLKNEFKKPCQTGRSEEHTSELQSLMRISYAVFCLKKKTIVNTTYTQLTQ